MKIFLFIILFPLVAFSQITQEELNFIEEVNLVRTNPRLYVSYVKEYVNQWGLPSEKADAPEVIAILEKMQPLKPLVASTTIRKEMETHSGIDTVSKWVNHSNWKWLVSPFDTGGENIIMSCKNTYRNMVIRHLIDGGISSRGHRKHILSPIFNTIAVKRIVFGDESRPFRCKIWWIEEYLKL